MFAAAVFPDSFGFGLWVEMPLFAADVRFFVIVPALHKVGSAGRGGRERQIIHLPPVSRLAVASRRPDVILLFYLTLPAFATGTLGKLLVDSFGIVV